MARNFKVDLGINEFKTNQAMVWKSVLAEFLGIFILNFFACGACTQGEEGIFPSLAFGLGVFIAITVVGHVSGGHVNPAVTIGMLVAGKISVIKSVLYIISQCLGAICATLALKSLLVEEYQATLGDTRLAEKLGELQGVGFEFFLGFVLVSTVFGATDENKPDSRFTAPLAIGMSVTLGHLGTIKYTGASMNPARTLGTAVATNHWDYHWVYWVGPILGGIAASLIYNYILKIETGTLETSERYRAQTNEREQMQKLNTGRDYA